MTSITIGLDIAKSVFQVHVEDAEGRTVTQRRLRRSQVAAFFARQAASVVGIEACGSAHYWRRLLLTLDLLAALFLLSARRLSFHVFGKTERAG
jgi:transposase